MDRRAVPIRVGMDSFGAERRGCWLRPCGVSPKQVSDTKAGHRLADVVAKHRTALSSRRWCTVQKGLDRLSRLRPQRAQSFLASLADKANETRGIQLKISGSDIEQLLH